MYEKLEQISILQAASVSFLLFFLQRFSLKFVGSPPPQAQDLTSEMLFAFQKLIPNKHVETVPICQTPNVKWQLTYCTLQVAV